MELNKNTHCYTFEKKIFNDGLLDETVDATYIINLEGNGRIESILNQLENYHPTNIVYIVHNKGYKKCEKTLPENVSYQDLTDAFLQCFKHSEENHYKNILILEDDFIFDEKIKDKSHIKNINTFNFEHKTEAYIFKLGVLPKILIPYNSYIYKGMSVGTHCCIYSEKLKKEIILKEEREKIKDWDIFFNLQKTSYIYYTPLCYQLFPVTENRESWGKELEFNTFFSLLNKIFQKIYSAYISILNLDKTPQPGYDIVYVISKILFYIILFLLFVIIHFINKKYLHIKLKSIKSVRKLLHLR